MFEKIKDRRHEGGSMLRKTQLVELYLLEVLDNICQEYGIRYFLVGGTLIGAMRHNGFIPWDDDIDVGMTMPDFRRFQKIVAAGMLPDGVVFQPPRAPWSQVSFAKLRDTTSFFGDDDAKMSAPHGIYIDIFPYDRMPNLPYRFVFFLVRLRSGAYRRWRRPLLRDRYSIVAKLGDCLCALMWKILYLGVYSFWHALRLVAPANGWHMAPEAEFPNRATDVQIFPLTKHRFENLEVPIPNDWEWMLSTEYANWHELPPVEQRVYHAKLVVPEKEER